MKQSKSFTKDEIIALKEVAEEHIEHNLIVFNQKTIPDPVPFPKEYKGPRSFAEAMSMHWNAKKQKWEKE